MILNAIVRGRVQGVGFRYFVLTTAKELHLTGWVRNLPDGAVQVEACGSEDDLDMLEQRLWKGPHFSRVEDVRCSRSQDDHEKNYSGFKIE
jgi:acylphosphatase